MSAPTHIRVKRPRDDSPLPIFFLEERQTKLRRYNVEYRLEGKTAEEAKLAVPTPAQTILPAGPRHFELSLSRKRNAQTAGLMPTFVEKRRKGDSHNGPMNRARTEGSEESGQSTPLKRPGRRTLRTDAQTTPKPVARTVEEPSTEVADALHQFAMEEAAQDEAEEKAKQPPITIKPRVIMQPKGSVRRLKDRQPQRGTPLSSVFQQDGGSRVVSMEEGSDDEDFVYDIYVKYEQPAKAISVHSPDPTTLPVGILVITEEDEALWESFLEGEEEEKFDTDDEDENAEDYYGADYPEDEVASDDEQGHGAYGYRHGGSDDEQWDSDTGAYSDEEEAMKNPWRNAPWLKSQRDSDGADEDMEDV